MTFNEFCDQWDVTLRERKLLVRYLAFLRMCQTLNLVNRTNDNDC